MKEFLEYILKNMVTDPDAVQVTMQESPEELRMEVQVGKEDVGKVVGKGGATIKALRTIATLVGRRIERKVRIDLLDT